MGDQEQDPCLSIRLEELTPEKEKEMIAAAYMADAIDKEMEEEGEAIKALKANRKAKIINKNKKKPDFPPEILKEKYVPQKARAFQFTFNDISKWPKAQEYLEGVKGCNYFIACREVAPTTGHVHIHCYAQFKTPTTPSMEKMGFPHVEKCYGSPEQNIAYIKKEPPFDESKRGEIIAECGTPRLCRTVSSIKEAEKLKEEELKELPLNYYNIAEKIKDKKRSVMNVDDLAKPLQVFYFWGPSGCGKTSFAKIAIKKLGLPFNQVKYENSFWSGVTEDCEVALYDDWRDSHMKPSEFINFVDYNIHRMNIKGGSVLNRYKYIFITSIQDPQRIYWESSKNNEEQVKQWIRRMKIVNIFENYGVEEIRQKYEEVFGIPKTEELNLDNLI